jgi:hypothetical protein
MNELHVKVSNDYEANREAKARGVYNYLATRGLLDKGLRMIDAQGRWEKWDAVPQEVRDIFTNMVEIYAEPSVVIGL